MVCVAVVKVIRGSRRTGWGCSSATLQASMLPRKRCSSSWHLRSSVVQLFACCTAGCCAVPALLLSLLLPPPLLLLVVDVPACGVGVVPAGAGVSRADSSTSRLMARVARSAAHDRLFGDRSVAAAAWSYASVSSWMRCSDELEPTVPGLIAPAASWNNRRACKEHNYVVSGF